MELNAYFFIIKGEIFKDSVITILVGGCECGFSNHFASYTKKLTLGIMSFQCNHNVFQAFTG